MLNIQVSIFNAHKNVTLPIIFFCASARELRQPVAIFCGKKKLPQKIATTCAEFLSLRKNIFSMHELKMIREMSGLSQQAIGAWLNVSRSMVYMVEQGKRSLPRDAHFKLVSMIAKLTELQKAGEPSRIRFTDPIRLAELHQQKMQKHRKLAESLQRQLEQLQRSNPRLHLRLALFNLMKEEDGPGYTISDIDKKFMEFTEGFTHEKLPKSSIAEQELLQDKIDTHLAYADLHQERWRMYVEME